MPIVVMGVLFGLAMDYEVFLVSRMREEYVHTGDAKGAVTRGFIGSGKVVTAAAVIMISVFVFFIPEGHERHQGNRPGPGRRDPHGCLLGADDPRSGRDGFC